MAQTEPAQAGRARAAAPLAVSKRVQVVQVRARVAAVPQAVVLRHSRATVAQRAARQGRLREVARTEVALEPKAGRHLPATALAELVARRAPVRGAPVRVAPVRVAPVRVAPVRVAPVRGVLALLGVESRVPGAQAKRMGRDPARRQVVAVQAPVAIRWQVSAAPALVATASRVNPPVAARVQGAQAGREAAVESQAQPATTMP
jgi:hypothetical protein